MKRADAIRQIFDWLTPEDIALCTTGMISREAFACHDRPTNFYTIGSLGLISALGLGLALLNPGRRIVVLDGDGSTLLSLGNLAMIARERPVRLIHIVLDNECYESTGSQPSLSQQVDLAAIAHAAGYPHVTTIRDRETLRQTLSRGGTQAGTRFLLVKVEQAGSPGIGRVSLEPPALTHRFRAALSGVPDAKEASHAH